jgi:uncharacterized protein (TIGR03083 family)
VSDPLTVLSAQCSQLLSLIDEFSDADWERPTRCPPMDVRELVVHVGQAATGTARLAELDASGREPNVDRARWWVSPSRRPPAEILANAQRAASDLDAAGAAQLARERIDLMLATFGRRRPDDVVGTETRTVRADELAGSRVLEFGIHTMDLGHATLRGERITPEAATFVTGILNVLLDAPLPAGLGWDARTYILSGTGRRELEPNERFALGPLAAKFPLLR